METGNKKEMVVKAIRELMKSLSGQQNGYWKMASYTTKAKFMSLTLTFNAASLHFVMTPRLLAILAGGRPWN